MGTIPKNRRVGSGWQGRGGGLHRYQLALTHHESHDVGGPRLWGSTWACVRKPHANAELAPHERRTSSSSLLSLTCPHLRLQKRKLLPPEAILWAVGALGGHLRSGDRGWHGQITSPSEPPFPHLESGRMTPASEGGCG